MPVEAVVQRFGGVSLGALALALILHVAKHCARARGWHNIVRAAYPTERLRFRETLGAFFVGVGVDAVIPARAGEVLRLELVRRRLPGSTFPGLVSTLFVEYVLDAILTVVVVVLVVVVGTGPHETALILRPITQHSVIAPIVAAGLAVAVGALCVRMRKRLRPLLADARRGLAVFANTSQYLRRVAVWQLTGWSLRVASVYWFLIAFGLPASLGAAALVVAVQLVVAAVPLTPGGAGSQQAILVVVLSTTTAATVLAFGIGMQAATVVANLALGAVSLLLMTGSLRWRALRPLPTGGPHGDPTVPIAQPAAVPELP